MVTITPTFAQPSENSSQFATQQPPTQVLNPTTESKRAAKQLIGYLNGPHNTCLRLEPHREGSKKFAGTCWSQCLRLCRRFCNAPKCYGKPLQCTRSDDVQPRPEADSNQSQLVRGRVLRSACARELLGLAEFLQRSPLQRFSSSRDGFTFGTFHSEEDQEDPSIEMRCVAVEQLHREKRLSVGRVNKKDNSQRKLGLKILGGTDD